jgi:alpha-D-ribose 1-methylphosphonate 5-triphosphate synthase subunit PhnL
MNAPGKNTVMLRTEALGKSFTLHLRGGVRIPVLSGVGLTVHAGECVVLSGPSGAGKSTLMRSLYGNYRADGGRILVRHRDAMVDIAEADPRTVLDVRKQTLGYVSQFLRVVPRVSAVDIVAEVLVQRGISPDNARARAGDLLLKLNIPPIARHTTRHVFGRRAAEGESGARVYRRVSGDAAG